MEHTEYADAHFNRADDTNIQIRNEFRISRELKTNTNIFTCFNCKTTEYFHNLCSSDEKKIENKIIHQPMFWK